MSERTRTASQNPDLVSYTQGDLESALDDFLKEQEPPEKINLFNFSTIAGLGMLFVTTLFILQTVFPWFGPTVDPDFIAMLPVLGGIMVALTGIGVFAGRRNRRKAKLKAKAQQVSDRPISLDDLTDKNRVETYALSQNKKLYKSRRDKRVFGVCGGIAKYLGLNPFAVRLMWAIATLSFAPVMFPLYIILGIIMPKEPPVFQIPYSK